MQSEVGVFHMEWLTPAVIMYTQKSYLDSFNTEGTELHAQCKLHTALAEVIASLYGCISFVSIQHVQ